MKIRTGFVSNSSSSSFIIQKRDLTALQLFLIKEHSEVGQRLGMQFAETDAWTITETETEISGSTFMDNFDMKEYFVQIGLLKDPIQWGD